jgi:hypothetical protein
MALPISPTPVLKGADSKRFNSFLKKNEKKRISKKERAKGLSIVKAILEKAKI